MLQFFRTHREQGISALAFLFAPPPLPRLDVEADDDPLPPLPQSRPRPVRLVGLPFRAKSWDAHDGTG